jgi:cytochrome c oxidase assembly protein subunit 15
MGIEHEVAIAGCGCPLYGPPGMTATSDSHSRIIRLWLWAVAALVVALVLVGGATRLTESGLSIVEWRPVTGVLPPLTDAAWQSEFAKYQTIPQYIERNAGMSLAAFQTIYWWEWTHRLLGRLAGAAFLLPFLFFLWRGWVEPSLRGRLWLIFGLGALQGAVGWWMVASGLAERTEVSQYRLATHLLLACLILTALVWTVRRTGRKPEPAPGRIRVTAAALIVLALLQIYLGALVAGLRAGLIYNTWPLIDGHLVPDAAHLWFDVPWWRNLFENTLTVQFDHRMVAYGLCALVLIHAADAVAARAGARSALVLAAAVILQACLGIFTLLNQASIGLALLHQAGAIVVLIVAVMHAAGVAAETPVAHASPHSMQAAQ